MSTRKTYDVKVLINQGCPANDGTRLSTDIYLPKKEGSWPCILIRTPYSNNDPIKKIPRARFFASHGYAVALQDVRGRYDSDGDWYPFFNEAKDGVAAQKWLSEQSFCNGNIAQMGRSYEGYCTWVSAFDHHPALKAIIPIVALPDPVVNVPWMNGSVMWNMVTWALMVHARTNQSIEGFDWENYFNYRPLNKLDEEIGFYSQPWKDWLSHNAKDEYWKEACYMHKLPELDIPALHVCGWYDDDGISTYHNFPTARQVAKSKDDQYLLVGPWPHATNTKNTIPGVDFGPDEVIDLECYILDWLDMIMGEKPEYWNDRARARLFIMGENKWYNFSDWPPQNVQETSFYLASDGSANSMFGDGALSTETKTQKSAESDTYTYDPEDPTPYYLDVARLQIGGPADCRPIERRDDVLCYTTEVLSEDITICGRIFAELWVSTNADDTEFCAKLCDVHPSGLSRQVNDGNITLSYRNSLEVQEPAKPGEINQIKIDMWATGLTFKKGHKIRLEVSSAAVPKFAPHTNTLVPRGEAVECVIAENTIYHSEDHPSRLILPVIPSLPEDK